jgi:T5SS/PEP-CTERM-associated repeat protein
MQGGRKQPVTKSVLFVFVIGVCLALFTADAQLVADGTTNVLDGITTNVIGTVTIGTNHPFTRLVVTNGATVSSTDITFVGANATANSNLLVVTGQGSRWSSSRDLRIGDSGSCNQVSILDGAVIYSATAELGYVTGGSNNLMLVSGPGSRWTNNGYLQWGHGPGSQLVVSNGGSVVNQDATIWDGGRASISGTGSVWSSDSLFLGYVSTTFPASQLFVTGGGAISNTVNFSIGFQSHSNSAVIADPGSVLRIRMGLILGSYGGNGNQLIISNGAMASAMGTSIANGSSMNQRMIVTGLGTLLTNQNDFYIGQVGTSNVLWVLDGGALANGTGYIGGSSGFNQVLISGTNSLWMNRAELYVGYSSARNQLVVSNGATVCDANGFLGYNSNTHSNTVVVTSTGSLWTNSSSLTVGTNGSFNQLFVTNGGAVVSGTTYIGSGGAASFSNRVVVVDTGSVLTTSNLFIGIPNRFTTGNQLIVGTGAVLRANSLTIGSSDVPLANSLGINGGTVIITNPSLSGTLLISNYGTVSLTSGFLRADYLNLGRSPSTLNFNGGTLQTGGTLSETTAAVGNGSAPATFELLGGVHNFKLGLVISNNAVLKGSGSILGNVTVNPGGTLAPGSSTGQFSLNGSLLLGTGSTNIMELNAADGTCDGIVGPTNLAYGGTLILSNLAGVLTNGSSFRLFSASNYSGAFSAILPPSPGQDLKWNTNELNVDGVLRVLALHSPTPVISGAQISGTSIQISASAGIPYDPVFLVTATNIASATVWEYLNTNRFDAAGNVIFNAPFSPTEPLRFFRLQLQ